jgi:IS5 family transposase
LLYRIRERIGKQVKHVRQTIGLKKTFRSFTRVSRKVLLNIKKLYRNQPEKRQQGIKQLLSMTNRAVRQASRISNSLYARGHKQAGRNLNQLVSVGKQIVNQTREVVNRIKSNTGKRPDLLTGDRGFDQSYKKQERCRRRWGINRLAIPKKGKKPHRDSDAPWFKKALSQRVKIEPVIGHLKADHRMDRCRYKDPEGDTTNVVWASAAWNMRKVTRLQAALRARWQAGFGQ